jgi:hypothetical protein
MGKAIGGTLVRTGKASLEVAANCLFDKIINIKFIRKSGGSFTLRSDYEPVFHKDNSVSFKTCSQKPDIKVSYRQVAESVAIEVEIEIINLFIGEGGTENADRMDAADGDPVQWCIIQMGYRQQFPDWRKTEKTTDLARFWDLNNNGITSEAEVRRGRQILVQILAGYQKTYPPDKVTCFKGIIGTLENGLRWNHTDEDLIQGYGDPEFPKDYSGIEKVLFQFVTRRFIRAGILHIAETAQDFTNREALASLAKKEFKQKIKIYGFKGYDGAGANPADRLKASAVKAPKVPADTEWTDLPLLENGIMSVDNANRFGVICAVSETLRSVPPDDLYGYGLTDEQAAALQPIPAAPFDDMQDTIGGQLVAIQQHYPFIRWYALTDGNFYFYHVKDTDKDLWSDTFVKETQKDNVQFLPAVYDITASGTRTIRCPFVSFISPMTTVLFQSRFALGTLVSYYYPSRTNAYLVITAAIEFATVQDINMMELMCVDLPPREIEVSETGEIKVKAPERAEEVSEVAEKQQERNLQWIEKTLAVVPHKTGATDTDSRWANIVEKELKPAFRPENWPEGQAFTEELALAALKDWNPEYFDPDGKYMKRSDAKYGESIENAPITGIGGRTGIKVPWLKAGEDKIVVRNPFQADYPEDQKVIV